MGASFGPISVIRTFAGGGPSYVINTKGEISEKGPASDVWPFCFNRLDQNQPARVGKDQGVNVLSEMNGVHDFEVKIHTWDRLQLTLAERQATLSVRRVAGLTWSLNPFPSCH
jgi:hypothetical protein